MGIRGAWLEGFELYRALVEAYTKRQLSYSEDIEYAFSGITAALTKRFGWNFISCLPESLIVYTLLWTPSYKANRPLISDNQADMQGSKPFPSWSRTGWTGDINYGLVQCTGCRSTSCVGPLSHDTSGPYTPYLRPKNSLQFLGYCMALRDQFTFVNSVLEQISDHSLLLPSLSSQKDSALRIVLWYPRRRSG